MIKHLSKIVLVLLFILSANVNGAEDSSAQNTSAAFQLTAEEKVFLQSNPVIRVHSEKAWIPYNFMSDGEPQGYINDYIRLLADKLGVKLKFVNGKSWQEYLHMLKYKNIDLISNMRITESREKFALFSDRAILTVSMGLLTKKENRYYSNLKNLKWKKLAVTDDFIYLKQLKAHYPGIELKYAKTTQELIDLVFRGEAEAAIDANDRFNYLLKTLGVPSLISTPLLKEKYLKTSTQYLGIRNDWPLLKSALDKAAKSISNEELLQLEEKWLMPMKGAAVTALPSQQQAKAIEPQSGSSAIWIILAVLSALAAVAMFVRYKVLEKTVTPLKMSNRQLQSECEELKKTARVKDDYLANMSHEIRTPINAVLGMSTLALQTDLDNRQYGYVSKIHNSADLLLGLVNQVLDFSKIEAGEMHLEKVEFNLNTIFENLSDIVCVQSNEKGVDVIFDVEHDVPVKLMGDPLRINQILINLVMNALKFTEKGEISIHAKEVPSQQPGTTLEFVVKDTGIGIEKEKLGKLFQAFSQADDSTTRLYGGTGLGLVISKQLINQMGGDIYVESVYGKGTRFIFTITVGLPEKPELRKYRLPSKESMKKKILIIDSNATSLSALHKKLEYFHFNIANASSWQDAEDILKEKKIGYDIIFVNAKAFTDNDIDAIMQRLAQQPSKIVFIAYDLSGLSDEQLGKIDSPAFLERPYSQQRLFDLLVQIEKGESGKSSEFALQKSTLDVIRGSKIIVAEDNKINQSIITGLLEGTGIEVTIANNGVEVLKLLGNSDNYDIILMDVNMPVMGGYEAAGAIREQKHLDTLPIIALTASMFEDDIRKSKEAGMNAHIGKPVHPQEFYATLLEFIPSKQEPSAAEPRVEEPEEETKEQLELSDLASIDVEEMLERVGCDREMLRSILDDFVEQFNASGNTLKTLIEAGRLQEAREITHEVLGVAGNISANKLCEAVRPLDNALKDGEAEQLDKLLTTYTQRLDTLLGEIRLLSA